MAECRYCERSGWFLSITENGLCNNCNPIVTMDILQRARIITDCLKLIVESKKLDMQLSRCDLLIEHATALVKYEMRGIPTINPLPSELAEEYPRRRDRLIVDSLTNEFEVALSKANIASGAKSKVNLLSKVLLKVREFELRAKDPAILSSLEQRIAHKIHEIQLGNYLEDAKKAEFKGQKKKALDQYYEALYLLKNDKIDDSLQQNNISFIESKIRDLGGSIAI